MGKQTAQQAPAAPNVSAIANAQGAAAAAATKNAQEQLQWARGANVKNTASADDAVADSLKTQDRLNNSSTADREQYENSAFPALQQEKADAATYASSAKKDLDVGAAQAGVAQNFDAARDNATQKLESYGVNPASTRFAALDIGARTQEAAAKAAAGTTASNNVDATGRTLNHQVLTDSTPLAGQSTTEANAGVSAGSAAVNNADTNATTGAATMGTGVQYGGQAASDLTGQAGTINTNYQSQIDATKANNDAAKINNGASSGVGSLLGTVAGLGLGGGSTVGGAVLSKMFSATGGPVDNPGATPGGAVPVHASPTGGKAVDDVPAQLTVGEYVVPRDVVEWKGQEHFQKLIDSSRKAASEATAKPKVGPAVGGPTTFRSAPQQGAIPMSHAA